MVILAPGQAPVQIDKDRYLQAVAALEASGQLAAAERFYQTALLRWPGDPLLMKRGCRRAALAEIDTALTTVGEDHPFKATLEETRREILEEEFGPVSSGCPAQ